MASSSLQSLPFASLITLITLITSFLFTSTLCDIIGDQFKRPAPGRVILTPHTKSTSHPQQVHVSAVGMEYMSISWITTDKHSPSIVEYGKVSGNYENSIMGEQTSYKYFGYVSGEIHHVQIGPLEPDTVYYYRCGGVGDEFDFKTPPSTPPIQFAIAGDLGQTEWTASTLHHVNQSDYDMLLLPGDLSYADAEQPLWDSFGRFVQPYASKRPWMVTQGNHEVESFPIFHDLRPFAAYNSRWKMAYEESGSTSNLYYSFDVANAIHVIMLGSYTEFDSNSAQYKWLVSDLAKVDRSKTPWLFVLVHVPWYNTNLAHQGEGEGMRKAMEDLLYKARVDVVFSGHVHAYERFTRIYDGKADPCGPVYITIGDGGNREGLALEFQKDHRSAHLSMFHEASFGHGRLKVINGINAHWSWHRNDDSISTVRDELLLESLSSLSVCQICSDFVADGEL